MEGLGFHIHFDSEPMKVHLSQIDVLWGDFNAIFINIEDLHNQYKSTERKFEYYSKEDYHAAETLI